MIKIVADTTCSVPREEGEAQGIIYLPQIIIFGEESYRDDTEIDTATFLQKLRASAKLPKTAAPPPALYTPIYQKYASRGDTLIVITPSSKVSGTFRSATVAAQEFPDADIRIIETATIAGGLGAIVLQANRWAQEGMDADTLVEKVKELGDHERVYFLVDTLEYLYKGGRIGGASALVGSVLQIKPILTFKEGAIESVETQRTKRRAVARIRELVEADALPGDESRFCISQCDAYDEAKAIAAEIGPVLGVSNVPIYEIPPAIVVHAGPKVLAFSYFHKID